MTVRINKQKINLREKLTEFEDRVNFDEVVRGLGEYAGNVGIGTSSPQSPLHVYNSKSSACRLFLQNISSSDYFDTCIYSQYSDLVFDAGRNPRMRITSTGNVGIGTANPNKKLYVDGPIRSTSSINYEDKEILLPGGSPAVAQLFVIEADSHYMVTVSRGDTPSQLTVCMVTTHTSPSGVVADVHIHEITNSGHYSIIYETANQSIRWRNDTVSNPPKINASVLKLK